MQAGARLDPFLLYGLLDKNVKAGKPVQDPKRAKHMPSPVQTLAGGCEAARPALIFPSCPSPLPTGRADAVARLQCANWFASTSSLQPI